MNGRRGLKHPFRHGYRRATFPKGTASAVAENLVATPKGAPLRADFPRSGGRCRAATKGGVWHRAAMTERAHAVALRAKASNAIRNLPAMPEPPSPRELANPQGLTEGAVSFTFVLAFPVYRISAKGARAENPHGIKGSCISFTIVLYFVPARRTFVCFVPSGGVQGPYLCAKMLLFSA